MIRLLYCSPHLARSSIITDLARQKYIEPQRSQRTQRMVKENEVSTSTIGAAIEVHRLLGPGLLESAYEHCLAQELTLRGIPFERQKEIPILYKGVAVDCGFRVDLLVAELVIVGLKAVDRIMPVHKAQVITYLKLTG